jgi:hypothetical protein
LVKKKLQIIIYGPPGSGKSQMVIDASVRGWEATDLEHLPNTGRRYIFLATAGRTMDLIAAADTDIRVNTLIIPEALHVLILPPWHIYNQRRSERDERTPAKRRQPDVYDRFKERQALFDEVIEGSSSTVFDLWTS